MKFLAVTLLAACLLQGLNANPQPQLGAIRSLFGGAARAAQNAAGGAANAAYNAAGGAANAAYNAAGGAASLAQNAAGSAANAALNAAGGAASLAQNAAGSAANAAYNAAGGAANAAYNAAGGAASLAQNAAGSAANAAYNAAGGAASLAQNAAGGAVSAVQSVANNAVNNARNALEGAFSAVNNIRGSMSDAARNVMAAAGTGNIGQLEVIAQQMNGDQLMEAIEGAQAEISVRVNAIESAVADSIYSMEASAVGAIEASGASPEVRNVLEKAASVGADVGSCAVSSVLDLGKVAATKVSSCVTNKIKAGMTLAKNIANLVPRSTRLAQDGVLGYRTCSQKTSNIMKRACQATKLAPVAVRSALLVKDAVLYTTQAARMVSTIQSDLSLCAAAATAETAAEAVAVTKHVVSCVRNKITETQVAQGA